MCCDKIMRSLYLLIILFCFSSCRDTKNNNAQTGANATLTEVVADSNSVEAHVEPSGTTSWIADFKKLRTAVLNNDIETTASYFQFPINTDSTSIWTAMDITGTELEAWKRQTQDSLYLSKDDFEHFYSRIFSKELKMGIAKIKSEELFSTGSSSSAEFSKVSKPFQFYANYDKESSSLSLNIAFFGGKDEEGNYVSEGEYNIIYVFKVMGDKLRFDRMVIAG